MILTPRDHRVVVRGSLHSVQKKNSSASLNLTQRYLRLLSSFPFEMATFLITGCSRGLGLELATQLAASSTNEVKAVIATARSDASAALKKLIENSNGRVQFVKLDVTNQASAKEAATLVASSIGHIDVLINNASSINWMSEGIDKM